MKRSMPELGPPRRRRLRRFRIVVGVAVLVSALVFLHSTDYLDTLGGTVKGARLERAAKSPNYREGEFQNPVQTTVMVPGGTWATARDWLRKARSRPERPLTGIAATRETFASPPAEGVRLTWLGHSTVLLEIEGERVLFDPVWAKRSSPTQLVGPARFQPNPLPLTEVPPLAAVVVSHDHYDHLDRDAIQALAGADPKLEFYVPLGVGAHFDKWGIAASRVHELDWWEETQLAGGKLRLVSAPARHFSGRGLFDRNATLWASWAVIGRQRRAYFGGDGGYWEGFAEIGRKLGPFDVTMLEIGAFHPNWGFIHLGPENALKAHRDLGGRVLLPIHWGTFDLGIHAWDEPIETLVSKAGQEGAALLLPEIGRPVALGPPTETVAWWR